MNTRNSLSRWPFYLGMLVIFSFLFLFICKPSLYAQSDLLQRANEASEENDLETAETLYLKLIELNQNKAIAMFNLANVYYRGNKIPKAAIYYGFAIEEAKQFKNAYLNLGKLYFSIEDYVRALQAFEAYLEQDSRDIDTLLLAGDTCKTLLDYVCTLRYYERAYAEDKENVDVLSALSSLYLSFEDYEKALSYLQRELGEQLQSYVLMRKSANVLSQAKRYTEASAAYISSIDEANILYRQERISRDELYQLYLLLADVLQQDGLQNVAIAELKSAIERFPQKSEAYYFLEKLMLDADKETEAFHFLKIWYSMNKNAIYSIIKNILAKAYNTENKILLDELIAFYNEHGIQDEIYRLVKTSIE